MKKRIYIPNQNIPHSCIAGLEKDLFYFSNKTKYIFLLVSLIAISLNSFSQSADNSILNFNNAFGEDTSCYDSETIVYIYDFNTDPSRRLIYKVFREEGNNKLKVVPVNFNKETLTPKNNVRFKIVNINRFMYNVSVSDTPIQFISQPPTLLADLFIGSNSSVLTSLLSDYNNGIRKVQNVDSVIESFTDSRISSLNNSIFRFEKNIDTIRSIILKSFSPSYQFLYNSDNKYIDKKYLEILSDLNLILSNKNVVTEMISRKEAAIKEKNKYKMIEWFKSIIKSEESELEKMESDLNLINQEISKAKNEEKYILENRKKIVLNRIEKKIKDIDLYKAKMILLIQNVNGDYDAFAEISIESLQNEKDALSEINNLFNRLSNDTVRKEIDKSIVYIYNMIKQNQSYTVDYVNLNGNLLDFTVNISLKESFVNYYKIPDYSNPPLKIQIPIVYRPFLSFSSGTFLAFGKHLQNKVYAWQEIVGTNNIIDNSSYTLVENSYTDKPFGFSAIANLEVKTNRNFGLGGSVGVGLTFEKDSRLVYLVGASIFLGDTRQFALTCGFATMQVNKLTNRFKIISDNQVIYTSIERPEIEYYKEFKVGGFISVTYTPFEIK